MRHQRSRIAKDEPQPPKKDPIHVGFSCCGCGWHKVTRNDSEAIDAAVTHSLQHSNVMVFHHDRHFKAVVFSRRTV
jgi:hypothetical protein